MARTLQTRKRSRGVVLVRPIKRRRMLRRRRFGRRSRLQGITNRMSGASSIGRFRTRRTRPSTFRRRLWQSTQDKSHYRSVGAAATAVSTQGGGNGMTQATLTVITPGNQFWTTGGGAVSEDAGVALPTFVGDIILRGGISKLSVSNRVGGTEVSPTDNVRVTIFTVWTQPDIPPFTFPAAVPITWDPSVFGDFQRYGKVIGKKEAILQAHGDSVEVTFRHRIQRIDQNVHFNLGSRLVWFVLVSEMSNSDTNTVETVDIVNSISYSFVGDAT